MDQACRDAARQVETPTRRVRESESDGERREDEWKKREKDRQNRERQTDRQRAGRGKEGNVDIAERRYTIHERRCSCRFLSRIIDAFTCILHIIIKHGDRTRLDRYEGDYIPCARIPSVNGLAVNVFICSEEQRATDTRLARVVNRKS